MLVRRTKDKCPCCGKRLEELKNIPKEIGNAWYCKKCVEIFHKNTYLYPIEKYAGEPNAS